MRLFAITLLLAAMPALAQTATSTPDAPMANKKVCRRMAVTGSIMPSRVCHTAAEWKQIDAANENANDAFRNRPGQRTGNSGI